MDYKSTRTEALRLYRQNIELSKALFGLPGIFEVTIRNHIDKHTNNNSEIRFSKLYWNLLELVGAFREILAIVGFFPIVWQKVSKVQIVVAVVQWDFGMILPTLYFFELQLIIQ